MKCDMCDENLAVQCENAILLCVRAYFVAHAYVCYWSRTRYKISNGVIRYNLITTLRTEAALSACIKIKHTAEIVGAR